LAGSWQRELGHQYGIIDGDRIEPEVWSLLDEAVVHRVLTTFDAKDALQTRGSRQQLCERLRLCMHETRQPRVISVRGEGGLGKPLIKGAGILTRTSRATGHAWRRHWKREIVNRLLVSVVGAGFCHFPCDATMTRCQMVQCCTSQRVADEEVFSWSDSRVASPSRSMAKTYIWSKR
jgi:hypothetical protein